MTAVFDGDPMVGYWILAAGAVGLTALSTLGDDEPFERLLGPVPALPVVATAALLGAAALLFLADRGWMPPATGDGARPLSDGLIPAVVAATVLAAVAVGFDNWIPFPEDTNAPWPQSILFYPVVGFVAEVVLHVVPLALIVAAFGWNLDPSVDDRRVWLAIVAVAGVEAVYQTVDALAGPDRRVALFVAPHLLVIGLVELTIFRRYGFVSMALFRQVYYILWHIVWGYLRLGVIF